MIDWYYVSHRYLALTRDKTREHSWLVAFVLLAFSIQMIRLLYSVFPDIQQLITTQFGGYSPSEASLIIFYSCIVLGTISLLLLSPPRLHYLPYSIWYTQPRDISIGYLLLSLFFPIQLLRVVIMAPILIQVQKLHADIWLTYFGLWLTSYYFTLLIHFYKGKLPVRSFVIISAIGIMPMMLFFQINPVTPAHWIVWLSLPVLIILCYYQLNWYQKNKGADTEKTQKSSIWGWVSFKNSLMQLEWALMTRNKRTRSNLIAGLISIPFIFYLFTQTEQDIVFMPVLLIGLVVTAFIMLQHGIYMIGWEGSYFDLLISRFSFSEFFEFKYRFFVLTSLGMFALSTLLMFWNPHLFIPLFSALMYNLGINIYIILQGSLSNTTRLDLNQKTVLNTQALNGTLLMNSILIVLVPIILYAFLQSIWNEMIAALILAALGALGMLFKRPILRSIISSAEQKKYSLANGFRS